MRAGVLRLVSRDAEGDQDLTVSVEDARAHLVLDHREDDTLLAGYLRTALDWLTPPRGWIGRSLMRQTLRLDMPTWCLRPIELPAPPLVSVTSIKYFDADNAEQTLDPTCYLLDEDTLVWTRHFTEPALYERPFAVRITYLAGFENAAAMPAAIKTGVLQLVSHWYENRDAVATAGALSVLPLGAEDLLATARIYQT
jgi:uncharacterized phiE125 gp8 family phage protein